MKGNPAAAGQGKGMRNDPARVRLILFLSLAAALLLAAAFAEYLCPWDPNGQDLASALQPPSFAHLFGTDRYGRDMLSRVLVGAKTSIYSSLLLVVIISVAGTAAGVVCGWFGGIADGVVMRISDICLAFPGLVFAMAVAAVLDGGVQNAVIALAVVSWPRYARLARSQTLAIKDAAYIQAAKLSGCSSSQIIFRHILPNIGGPVLVTAVLDIGTMMMEIAALSFLGLGARPPVAEWGSMMSDGRSMLQTYPWTVLTPGLAIFLSVAVFNLLGDAARDYLDPRGIAGKKKSRRKRRSERNRRKEE
jgi:peptide/nickel transport system permease protein